MSASLSASAVAGGFRNPVFDAQTAFRRIMDAFARPGTIADLGNFVEAPPALPPAAAALVATLADADVAVFLDAPGTGDAAAWIAFQTGAAIAAAPADAVFVVLAPASDPAGWGRFPIGTDSYPDRSATLLLPVEALEGGAPLRLSGPGIESSEVVAPRGLPDGFLASRAANATLFPRGHDLVLVAGARLLALPRTTSVKEA
ncbi:phosphonate C-P lyase system protein PhnH [Aureimonas leprariae]|uniref:Phosphonate C-P lyase system protein PhnH n=1 Tax=Plantimonas leprariae TaxID=2615207 RepID=A0A7V7PLM6_9HYPH|nr:phosphonate C-P lyase system protein PhnH [Aureimonas leprariae]KAB0677374.1 phosphonate C-P lyase system protein PhnH [Aureimonas leprariae]